MLSLLRQQFDSLVRWCQAVAGTILEIVGPLPAMLVTLVVRVQHHPVRPERLPHHRRLVHWADCGVVAVFHPRLVERKIVGKFINRTSRLAREQHTAVGSVGKPDTDRILGMMDILLGVCGKNEQCRPTLEIARHLVPEDLDTSWWRLIGNADTEGENVGRSSRSAGGGVGTGGGLVSVEGFVVFGDVLCGILVVVIDNVLTKIRVVGGGEGWVSASDWVGAVI